MKYQGLRNSLLASQDFSLDRFSNVFTPRSYQGISENNSLQKVVGSLLTRVLDKTMEVIEIAYQTSPYSLPLKKFHSLSNELLSVDNSKGLIEFTCEVEDFEKKIYDNLENIKETIRICCNDLQVLDKELRKSRSSFDVVGEGLHRDVIRENQELREEIKEMKENWEFELGSARTQWNCGLDKMQKTYELNIKELTDSHDQQVQALNMYNKEKINSLKSNFRENEKKLLEKLESMTSDQSEILNKLNDKIAYLNSKVNEDGIFIENLNGKLEEIFEKYRLNLNSGFAKSFKEKILSKVNELGNLIGKSRGLEKFEKNPSTKGVKQRLIANSSVVKEFEEARCNLLKHFAGSPKKTLPTDYPLTSRY